MAKQSFYAVQKGRNTGVYQSWAQCQTQVTGYPGAIYKKFPDAASAAAFANSKTGYDQTSTPEAGKIKSLNSSTTTVSEPKGSFYAVSNGRLTGVFKDWNSCKPNVEEFHGAKYKKFSSVEEAEQFVKDNTPQPQKQDSSSHLLPEGSNNRISKPSTMKGSLGSTKVSYYGVNYKDGSSRIFKDWSSCQRSILGQKGVTYKKFDTLDGAKIFTTSLNKKPLTSCERSLVIENYLLENTKTNLSNQQNQEVFAIYTDGSYFPNGKSGMGVYFGTDDYRNISSPVYDSYDSYSPEVRALAEALKIICNEIDQFGENKSGSVFPKYTIFTDSEASTNVLNHYGKTWEEKEFKNRKEGEILYEMFKHYSKIQSFYHKHSSLFNDHIFTVTWIKGHAGHPGNEAADTLARQGAFKS